jgi:hypothetical protein
MVNQRKISALLNEVWMKFIEDESETVETNEGQTITEPPKEEQQFFTTLLKSCQSDMRDTVHKLPYELIYWRHPEGDDFFTVGWMDRDECVTAFYTVDVEETIVKRWPGVPTNYRMFKP